MYLTAFEYKCTKNASVFAKRLHIPANDSLAVFSKFHLIYLKNYMKYRVNVKSGLLWDFFEALISFYIFLETPPTFPNLHPFQFCMNKITDNFPNKRECLFRWDLNPVSIQQFTFCRCSPLSTLGPKSASTFRRNDSNYVVDVSLGLCQYGKLTVISLN